MSGESATDGGAAPLVLVTGVSGFLGAHCAQQLLAAGYRVRGTVRSLNDERKIAHVRTLHTSAENLRNRLAEAS